jgi:metal-responsive CopG/Arc/MetJ family transcriptional regulator
MMAKVLISMDEDFLGKVDKAADAQYSTRSGFIRQALFHYVRSRKQSGTAQILKASQNADLLESLLLGD